VLKLKGIEAVNKRILGHGNRLGQCSSSVTTSPKNQRRSQPWGQASTRVLGFRVSKARYVALSSRI
jgi:hypothetical protein